jgi:hypothetical protein
VDVEKRYHVARLKDLTVRIPYFPARSLYFTHVNMARDDGVRDLGQPAVPEVDVGATHLGKKGPENYAAGFQHRFGELYYLHRPLGRFHDRSFNHNRTPLFVELRRRGGRLPGLFVPGPGLSCRGAKAEAERGRAL